MTIGRIAYIRCYITLPGASDTANVSKIEKLQRSRDVPFYTFQAEFLGLFFWNARKFFVASLCKVFSQTLLFGLRPSSAPSIIFLVGTLWRNGGVPFDTFYVNFLNFEIFTCVFSEVVFLWLDWNHPLVFQKHAIWVM